MLKACWVWMTAIVWLVTCAMFVAALATWATAGEPVSVASWRPAGVATAPGPDDLRAPVSLQTWRPAAAVTGPPVSLASWRPQKREMAAAPVSGPPAALVMQQPQGYWQQQCTRRGCRLLWVPLR